MDERIKYIESSQIKKDVPIDLNLKKCCWTPLSRHPKRREKVTQIFKNLEFYSLIKKLPEIEKPKEKETAGENLKLW